MEAVGSAASIIAVIELSAKVASLCFQYSSAVKNARSDVERLQGELERLTTTLQGAQRLLESPNGKRLQTSQGLRNGLIDCSSQLSELQSRLEKKLNPGSARKAMSRIGFRALKWPFESKEIDDIIKNLERYRDTLSVSLAVDGVTQVLDVGQTFVLSKLPTANDAAFDSHADEHDARCHPRTRTGLLESITKWADNPHGEIIFWLNGMAGTGKSTISRTVAQSFADRGLLGASFFFKRGERDRSNAALLFTTIAAQLVAKEPDLAPHVRAAIEDDPSVMSKALREQFEKLILKPLGNLKGGSGGVKEVVLVIDALDECERDNDIRVIIYLLSQAKALSSVSLKAFLTSRPELPVRLGFSDIKGTYQDLVLHEIPKPIIEHDIAAFLDFELARIRHDYNAVSPTDRQLPPEWPGCYAVQILVDMAVPLFIFAATVCRFIQESGCDPRHQLAQVLQYQSRTHQSEIDKLEATYRPVLDRLLVGSEAAKRSAVARFRVVVGSIVLLAEPLSIRSLARLLDIPEDTVFHQLQPLHSVLSVPASTESPVRTFHLSFRDFLLADPNKGNEQEKLLLVDPDKGKEQEKHPFWVDGRKTHQRLAVRCLELLSTGDKLKKDACGLRLPGTHRSEIDQDIIDTNLPIDIQYACRYWVHHWKESQRRIRDGDLVDRFLTRHVLHWLEALGILGWISESIEMVGSLLALLDEEASDKVSAFLLDTKRVIRSHCSIIDIWPLQVYYSAIVFAPKQSVVRRTFRNQFPVCLDLPPKVELDWDACIQTLEGHTGSVWSVAFSHDSKTIASASDDNTIKLWDAATGDCTATLEGHTGSVQSVAFSHDSKTVASTSYDNTIELWDAATGDCTATLEGHTGSVQSVAFSHDSKTLASASEDNAWVTWGSHKVLWLPPTYRPGVSDTTASTVAIGCPSGRVVLLAFSFSHDLLM
ncbi:vegetative incompatibility protein HET-E-1 [Chaetomidium leptoderma]|uniref:Vegetative incompatibility protein HET-E-1 n=1 Tax=Chaetomidium leptoderma TaxID=669021 RepID=A0AAN6VE80_9PEZI|nr:vegetative incompatibility protein HET-E-1 [Chaetomidium leptoderma]